MNLRDLTKDQEAILAQVESGDFSLDDVSDHLEMLEEERNKKIENYLYVINKLDSQCEVLIKEIDRLSAILIAKRDAVKRVKDMLLHNLKDGEKHEYDLFSVTRVKGREKVNILSELSGIPTKYLKTTISADKRLIMQDLKAGKEVKGAELITGESSLRLK